MASQTPVRNPTGFSSSGPVGHRILWTVVPAGTAHIAPRGRVREECLTVYRERDAVEKAFCSMKTDLQVMPLKVRTEATLKGYLFITFLSLILRMRLLKRMKDTGLLEHYTLEGLLLELAKIKRIRLANGEVITTEISKRQRTILETRGVCA